MSHPVISIEHLSKQYDLGVIGTGTLSRDLNRWWARIRKQPDPYTRIGKRDAFEQIGESILALDDISFTVQQGEALGIIGRNGAGKSTLLKILSRVTAPTSGVVKVKGRIGSLLEVGTGFHPELTGRENVYLNGAILGMKKAEVMRKFDEIVDFSGVEKFIDTPVKRYSSGMYVRLAFAVAAHLDPEILVVDEVLAVGDAEFQKKCLGKMSDVAGEGRTVLFVSHNMEAIERLCSNSICLSKGKIKINGLSKDVISTYLERNLPTEKSLILRKDRHGSQKILFKNLSINKIGDVKESRHFFTGDSVQFCLTIYSDQNYSNAYVGLKISDDRLSTIFSFNSQERGIRIKLREGENLLRLIVPNLMLLEGSYYIHLIALDPNKVLADQIENVDSFQILSTDVYQSGHPFSTSHGKILIPHTWENI